MSTEPNICWNCKGLERQLRYALEALRERNEKLAVAVENLSYIDWEMDSLVHAAVDHKGEINPDWLEEKVLELKTKSNEALALIKPDTQKESEE